MKDETKQAGLEGKRLWRHPWSDIDDEFERGVTALPEHLCFELQEHNQAWLFSERHTVQCIEAKVQKSQINNFMYLLSPCIRSGLCCTTRLCRPCCGSGWRPGTFTNRWPRSLRRAKMATHRRPLNSPCWGKHKNPCNPPQPWLPQDRKAHKQLCMWAHVFLYLCMRVCSRYFWSYLHSLCCLLCVYLQRPGTGSLHNYLLPYFIFSSQYMTWLRLWDVSRSLTQSLAISVPTCNYDFKLWRKDCIQILD